ncbi:MAG: glycosyltransferase family 4 protein [Microthrixaceae bacterium]
MTDQHQSSRHLLSVIHAAERTGPPLLALQFLRWLKEQRPSWQLSTLFLDAGGPLVEDFERLGPTVVNASSPDAADERHPWLAKGIRERRIQRTLTGLGHLDLAHVHCAGSMRAIPMIPRSSVLCHVHELSVGQDFHLGEAARRELPNADRYIAVSDSVRKELLARFDIAPELVERQWGFVDEAKLPVTVGHSPERGSVREAASTTMVVIGSGVRHWRKAPELFVRVALRARELHPQIDWQFQWIGGSDNSGLEQQVIDAGLDQTVRFIPHQVEPLRWVAAADAFFLSAREDAFPLVVVEAAALARPIVSFESGGAAELIRSADCGAVIPFPDVDAACNALAELATDKERRNKLGEAGAEFARENLVLSVAGPALLASIERAMEIR